MKDTKQKDLTMRETRTVQLSIFDSYSKHDHGVLFSELSQLLDKHPEVLELLSVDLVDPQCRRTGSHGMSIESVLRCLLLKRILEVSYEKLAFHLSDSITYRSFARIEGTHQPSRSGLQSVVRKIRPETLQKIHQLLFARWHEQGLIDSDQIRIDSTVVETNIAPPSDSGLLNDSIRVLSRQLATCHRETGFKVRYTDQRSQSKRLAFAIFHGKNTEKQALYPKLLFCAGVVVKQVNRTLEALKEKAIVEEPAVRWMNLVEHHRQLLCQVIHQTQQRIYNDSPVASSEKIVSIFEPHTDIIVKSAQDVYYGHKINLATDTQGLDFHVDILQGNPADTALYLPVLDAHRNLFGDLPHTTVADGGYASAENAACARAEGVSRAAFHKRTGLGYHAMGVKKKTLRKLRAFRAGIEGNISELKRSFGLSKANWKKQSGFDAFVWAGVLSYNLVRMCRLSTA